MFGGRGEVDRHALTLTNRNRHECVNDKKQTTLCVGVVVVLLFKIPALKKPQVKIRREEERPLLSLKNKNNSKGKKK